MKTDTLIFREDVRFRRMSSMSAALWPQPGFSLEAEVEVAVELVQERLAKGLTSEYFFVFAEQDGKRRGLYLFGPIACTLASYDLYWIVVHP